MSRKKPRIPKPNRFEINNSAILISISFDPNKLVTLLMGVAACDEMRRQLKRRKKRQLVRINEVLVDGEISDRYYRQYIEYEIQLQGANRPESVPVMEWPQLARQLNLYVGKDDTQLRREAKLAIRYIREQAHDKLVRVVRQFLFEGLHAATGRPITEEKRKELEELGTMVDRCWELRMAGQYKPADLRNWKTSEFKQALSMAIRDVGRKQTVTYDRVAKSMQREIEFVPILTGETLRKAISHHKLNWKVLKNRKI